MYRITVAWLMSILLIFSTASPGLSQSPQAQAERFVQSTWTEAEQIARTLILRDFLEAFNAVAEQQRQVGNSLSSVQDPTSQAQALIDALRSVSDTSVIEIERGEVQLNKLLDAYRDAVARRYRMSWYSTNALLDSRELADSLVTISERLRYRCELGASAVGDDFYTAPRPALPQLDFGVSTHFTFSIGSGRLENASGTVSDGKDNDTKGAVTTLASVGASLYCGPWCGAAAGLLVSGVYALVDMNDRLEEQSDVARAEGYRLSKRAVSSDVNRLYRQQCSAVVGALQITQQIVNMTKGERAAFIAKSDTELFRKRMEAIKAEQIKESAARCKVNAVEFDRNGACWETGAPAIQPVFDPSIKCSAVPDAKVQCAQQITKIDSGCRRDTTQLAMYPVYTARGSFQVTLGAMPSCSIPRDNKDVSAEVRYLQALNVERSSPDFRDQYTRDVSLQMALIIAKTLDDSELLQGLFTAAEADIDREQQYAFKNLVRLIQFVRVRKETVTLTEEIRKGIYPEALKVAARQLVNESGAILRDNSEDRARALRSALTSCDSAIHEMAESRDVSTGPIFDFRVNVERLRKVLE